MDGKEDFYTKNTSFWMTQLVNTASLKSDDWQPSLWLEDTICIWRDLSVCICAACMHDASVHNVERSAFL